MKLTMCCRIAWLLLAVAAGCYCQQAAKCPAKEDIKPCTCKKGNNDGKIWITCASLTSIEQFRRATKPLGGYQISTFYLENSNLGVLPADIFSGMTIDSLNIMFTNISSLSEGVNRPPFLGLESSLQYLEIKEVFLSEETPLARLSLSHLKKLTLLQLESNVMPTVGNDWFESGPYGLTQLHLLDSYTKKVGKHAFAFLRNLKQFSLTGGEVSEISREMFSKPALSLEMIDLSNNAISSIPVDLFTYMPSLVEVYLDGNALTTIAEIVWAPIWSQLTHVFVFDNAIVCDENIKWIYKYRLPEFLHGCCSSPATLRDTDLYKLTLKDLQ